MRKLAAVAVLMLTAISVLAFRPAAVSPAPSIEGAWRIVAFAPLIGPQAGVEIEITQPSLHVFTERHFATVFVSGTEPRAPLPEDPTDEQLLAAWAPLQAMAGTYEIDGNEIRTSLIVSKSPNDTADRKIETSTFEIDGEVFYRFWPDERGVPAVKVKHVRVG